MWNVCDHGWCQIRRKIQFLITRTNQATGQWQTIRHGPTLKQQNIQHCISPHDAPRNERLYRAQGSLHAVLNHARRGPSRCQMRGGSNSGCYPVEQVKHGWVSVKPTGLLRILPCHRIEWSPRCCLRLPAPLHLYRATEFRRKASICCYIFERSERLILSTPNNTSAHRSKRCGDEPSPQTRSCYYSVDSNSTAVPQAKHTNIINARRHVPGTWYYFVALTLEVILRQRCM